MSLLRVDNLEPLTGGVAGTIEVTGNIDVGTSGDPKALDVAGNVLINNVGVVVTSGGVSGPSVGVNGDGAISGALTLTETVVAGIDDATVVMRASTGIGTTLTQEGFIKMYRNDGVVMYVPYFLDTAGV